MPHIVFDPRVRDYFPGPSLWASAASAEHAPREVATSGLIQPPMHAIALERICALAADAGAPALAPRVRALYPKVLAWHR